MKRFLLVFAFLMAIAAPAAAETGERNLCVVCQVDEDATVPELVRATRQHGDREVRFCSERCARIFEKDPHRYLAALDAADKPAGAGSDSLFALDLPGGGHVSTTPT